MGLVERLVCRAGCCVARTAYTDCADEGLSDCTATGGDLTRRTLGPEGAGSIISTADDGRGGAGFFCGAVFSLLSCTATASLRSLMWSIAMHAFNTTIVRCRWR